MNNVIVRRCLFLFHNTLIEYEKTGKRECIHEMRDTLRQIERELAYE